MLLIRWLQRLNPPVCLLDHRRKGSFTPETVAPMTVIHRCLLLTYLFVGHYRPQTKFAKVMFLHVSVILSTGGWHAWQGERAWQGACVAWRVCTAGGMRGGGGGGGCVADTTRYGQWAGSTHPIGMHSCCLYNLLITEFICISVLAFCQSRCRTVRVSFSGSYQTLS